MLAPKVSVLIPTYNYGRFLDEALQSVLQQTFSNFEVLVVDNQSSDNTEAVVAPYLADARVRYFKNAHNLGLTGNLNRCLELANGKYIKFLMADDKFHPLLLERMVAVLDEEPGVSLVTSYSEVFGNESKQRQQPCAYRQRGQKVIQDVLRHGALNWIGEPTTVMFRAKDLAVGFFNSAHTCLVDLDMWLRLLSVGDCYIIPEVLSYFRVHEQQTSSAKNVGKLFEEYAFCRQLKNNKWGIELPKKDVDRSIRHSAINCSSAMFQLLPNLGSRKNRTYFWKSLKIAVVEGVLAPSIVVSFNRYRRKRKMLPG